MKLPEPKTALELLPFHTSPKFVTEEVGTPESGILVFPVYNDLSVTEAAWMAANGANKQAFAFTSKLALRIAREKKVAPIVAHNFVARILASALANKFQFNGVENDWAIEYADGLEETALGVLDVSINACVTLATCLIRHRLPGMQDWTPAQTRTLPNGLVEAIYSFGLREQANGKIVDPQKATEDLIEALGKSSPEPGKSPRKRTGQKSSGSSETSTPETPSSPEIGSDPWDQAMPSTL